MPIVEDFLQLPTEEKLIALNSVNPDFSALPDEEKTKVISSIESGQIEISRLFEQGQIEKDAPEYTQAQSIYLSAKPFIEPVAEAGALVGGGIVGGAAGLVTPIPGGAPTGAVIGAGLAFGGVKQLFNFIETSLGLRESPGVVGEFAEAGKEVVTGAAYEAGGQAIRPAFQLLKRQRPEAMEALREAKPPKLGIAFKEKTAKREAARRIAVETLGTEVTQPQIVENIKVAKQLERKIPGLKFTQGQLTNDASAIALERSLARHGGQDLSQSQRTLANKTLREYYQAKAVGTGEVEAFTGQVQASKQALETASKEAEQKVGSEVMRLSRHMDEQATGRNIWSRLSVGKKAMRDRATGLYNKIPDVKVKTDDIHDALLAVKADFDPVVEKSANYPSKLVRGVLRKISVKPIPSGLVDRFGKPLISEDMALKDMGFQELRKLRSQILAEIRTAQTSATPNNQYIRRLQMILKGPDEGILGGIEGAIDSIAGRTDRAGELYREASSFYREYSKTFGQGTVADVLTRGRRGEDTRIAMANIAREFNSLDSIDDFMRAVGDDSVARSAMKDFYSYDLLNSAKDPATGNLITKKAKQWLVKNSGKLKKLGIYDDYKNVTDMQRIADASIKDIDIFNKSVAGRVLEADMETFISNSFRGSKNFANTAQELMNLTKGNVAAQKGLKKGFAEYLMKESEVTGLEFFQLGRAETPAEFEFTKSIAKLTKQVKRMSPAIRVMFKDEPEKVKAIHDVWKAYQTLDRTAKSALLGGSDTAEHLASTALNVFAGSTAPGKWYAFKSVRDAVNRFSRSHVEEYLRRAMFDPDYAANLIAMSKARPATPEQLKNFNRLMTLITYKVGESIEGGQ